MKRDELRASLEAKGIVMRPWPEVSDDGHVLVVDEWGTGAAIIEVGCWTRNIQAVSAVDEWAEKTYEAGGFSDNYPDADKFYVIFHDGVVLETCLSTDWCPSFVASIKEA